MLYYPVCRNKGWGVYTCLMFIPLNVSKLINGMSWLESMTHGFEDFVEWWRYGVTRNIVRYGLVKLPARYWDDLKRWWSASQMSQPPLFPFARSWELSSSYLNNVWNENFVIETFQDADHMQIMVYLVRHGDLWTLLTFPNNIHMLMNLREKNGRTLVLSWKKKATKLNLPGGWRLQRLGSVKNHLRSPKKWQLRAKPKQQESNQEVRC